jgi:FkbM family methyltransferase
MWEPDRYLSFVIRRMRKYLATRYSAVIIRSLQQFYARHYAGSAKSWTVIRDFDGNMLLKIDRSSFIGSSIYWNGYYSLNELHLLKRLLRPHMVFVDVGANQGEFTLYAAKRLVTGEVLAFEPVEESYRHLTENIELNGFKNVIAYNVGLSDRDGYFEMYMPDNVRSSDQTIEGLANEGTASVFQSISRPSMMCTARFETLDKLFEESGLERLDIIKIDVEGAELPVLRGARRVIEKYCPIIIMEMNDESFKAAGYQKSDVLDFLDSMHYDLFLIGSHRSIHAWRYGFAGRYGRITRIDRHNLPDYCNVMCRYSRATTPA